MHLRRFVTFLTPVAVAVLIAACSGGTSVVPGRAQQNTTFAMIVGAPTTLSGANQVVSIPAVPGVSTFGGTLTVTAGAAVTAVVTIASATSAGTSGGPPVALTSTNRRSAQDFSGVTTSPQYYVGITNTTGGAQQVTFSSLTLGVNVSGGQSVALAHYDPSQPQNGWNQHCAFGSSQVSQNGSNTTFTPNANLTIYPGATLWFAPYTYPSTTTSPTAPPSAAPTTPTPGPAPASLTGTYIGTVQNAGGPSQFLEFALTQSGGSLSGAYAALPLSSTISGSVGTLSGTVAGGAVTLTATAQYGDPCTTSLTGAASGILIVGTFTSGAPCNGTGTFSGVLQSASLPSISGTYNGTIDDVGTGGNGSGTLGLSITTPGTVFIGNGTVAFPANPGHGGTAGLAGFVTSPTTAEFGIIASGNACNPFGTFTISGGTLTGSYANSGDPSGGCLATGTFSVSN